MTLNDIVARVNRKLAGERLTYSKMIDYLDSAVDDINLKLNARFPVFSELAEGTVEYTAIPDIYIRKVVIPGAAWYFFTMDEEGMPTATQFGADFDKGLFMMLRDYVQYIPEEYQAPNTAILFLDKEQGEGGMSFNGYELYQ